LYTIYIGTLCSLCITYLFKEEMMDNIKPRKALVREWTHKAVEEKLHRAFLIDCLMPKAGPRGHLRSWATVPRLERTGGRWVRAPRQGGPSAHDEEEWITTMAWLQFLPREDAEVLWRILSGEWQYAIGRDLGRSPKQMTRWKQKILQTIADHLNNGDTPSYDYQSEVSQQIQKHRIGAGTV